jgi:hypothetical protein
MSGPASARTTSYGGFKSAEARSAKAEPTGFLLAVSGEGNEYGLLIISKTRCKLNQISDARCGLRNTTMPLE